MEHKRKGALTLLVLLVLLLAWLIYGMISDLRSQPVTYHIQYTQPVMRYLCPGDTLRYEVQVEVAEVPAALTVVESWCQVGSGGVCDQATTREYRLGVLRPRQVYALANRSVPETDFLVPGDDYEFWHTTTTVTNRGTTVSGYAVGPVTIRNDCDTAEGK